MQKSGVFFSNAFSFYAHENSVKNWIINVFYWIINIDLRFFRVRDKMNYLSTYLNCANLEDRSVIVLH